ncbi:MAG: hypothetical protein ACPGQS_11475 [Bradymonadia bacterium]
MNVAQHQVSTLVSIGVLLLFCASCAESTYPESTAQLDSTTQPMNSNPDQSMGNTQADDGRPDASTDLYIPPPPVDMDMLEPEEVEFTLRRCVERMLNYLRGSWAEAGCDTYTMEQRSEPAGPYAMEPVTASCMKLECTGQPLEGHNGIIARRSCRDIDDIIATLTLAEQDVDSGICGTPTFKLKVLTLDQWSGPEPCDALVCGLEPDGNVIAIDQRN